MGFSCGHPAGMRNWPIGPQCRLDLVSTISPAFIPAAEAGPAIGIVGGGQLAWMLAEAARARGAALHVQTPADHDPAVRLASSVVSAGIRDAAGTRELARRCSAISFENEWVDLEALAPLAADGVQFVPSLEALRPLVCKRSQRELLDRLHLPSPRWLPLDQLLQSPEQPSETDQSRTAAANSGDAALAGAAADSAAGASDRVWALPSGWAFPVVAKAATGGYDGKGTQVLRRAEELEDLLQRVQPQDWILEEFVAFEQELALVAGRDRVGAVVWFPLAKTHQHQQVCDWVLVPAQASHALEQAARNIAASLLTALDYVGVLSIEFFYGPAGLQVNELAPRTHNSGHYSIEACSLSQFALQLQLVSGQTALQPELSAAGALMVNLLGYQDSDDSDYLPQRQALAALPQAHLHWYGKRGSSLGRKLGHLTLLLHERRGPEREQEAMARLGDVRAIWPLPPS